MGKKDKERRIYPAEFKAEAAAPARKHEKPVCQAASDLGISEKLRDEALTRLRKEVKALRTAG
jgi:transposase-like protein